MNHPTTTAATVFIALVVVLVLTYVFSPDDGQRGRAWHALTWLAGPFRRLPGAPDDPHRGVARAAKAPEPDDIGPP